MSLGDSPGNAIATLLFHGKERERPGGRDKIQTLHGNSQWRYLLADKRYFKNGEITSY
jgi:hypothetical protein